MKGNSHSLVIRTGTAALWILLLSVLFILLRVKLFLTDLEEDLCVSHKLYMQSFLDLDDRLSALDADLTLGLSRNSRSLAVFQARQESFNESLSLLCRQLSMDFASDFAALSGGQAVLTAALKEKYKLMEPGDDVIVQSLFSKGSDSFAEKRYGEAAGYMSELLFLVPDYPEARLIHAVARYRENPMDSCRLRDIKADLAAVISGDPHNTLALESLGSIALEEQQWKTARAYYRRLIGLDSRNMDYCLMFVLACRADGFIEEAAEEIDVLLKNDPADYRYLLYRGEVLEGRGEYEESFDFFQESCRKNPGCIPAIMGAAHTAMQTGRYRRAGELLLCPAVPKNYESLSLLAECSVNLGDGKQACEWWRQAIASLKVNTQTDKKRAADCYVQIARLSLDGGDLQGALDAADKGLRLDGGAALRLIRAKVLLKSGRRFEARRELLRVCQSDEDPRLCEEAGNLLEDISGEQG